MDLKTKLSGLEDYFLLVNKAVFGLINKEFAIFLSLPFKKAIICIIFSPASSVGKVPTLLKYNKNKSKTIGVIFLSDRVYFAVITFPL